MRHSPWPQALVGEDISKLGNGRHGGANLFATLTRLQKLEVTNLVGAGVPCPHTFDRRRLQTSSPEGRANVEHRKL